MGKGQKSFIIAFGNTRAWLNQFRITGCKKYPYLQDVRNLEGWGYIYVKVTFEILKFKIKILYLF